MSFCSNWLDKLNLNMVQILASLPEDINLQKLAEIANNVADSEPATPVYAMTIKSHSVSY